MKNLYNEDGSLCSEAQILLSTKPTEMSIGEWKKKIKELKVLLSIEDLNEFERLKAKENNKRWRSKDPEKSKQSSANWRTANPEKSKQSSANWRTANPEKSKQSSANWYVENPEKSKESNARWYAENTEKAKENNAKWRAKNPEKSKESNANWRAENPEKSKESNANWRAENPEHVASYMNDYHKQRKAKDPLYRLHCNMRSIGNRVVKQLSLGKKPACTEKWQGCTAEELKAYLESLFTEGMTWENYGEWHVDHIRPVSSFAPEEWEQINHYTNLQPLWAEDNLSKSDSYN